MRAVLRAREGRAAEGGRGGPCWGVGSGPGRAVLRAVPREAGKRAVLGEAR